MRNLDPKPAPSILIVDENAAVRRMVRALLERNHYKVLDAVSSESALALFGTHAGEIGLLITDVHMPGMDGNELVRRVRDVRPGLRVLFLTAYPGDVDDSTSRFEIVPKPFSNAKLLRAVAALMVRTSTAGTSI